MQSFYTFYFSPTGGTQNIANLVSKAFNEPNCMVDLSLEIQNNILLDSSKTAIFVFPSFAGRLPQIVLKRLEKVQGTDTKAILVVTFGNRAIDDTLLELSDYVKTKGFIPIAGMAIVTKHSIFQQFGINRPNELDKKWIDNAVGEISKKLKSATLSFLNPIPGKYPYKELHDNPLKPITGNNCISCGSCVANCPTGAIEKNNPMTTNYNRCISCMRCISICPQKARFLDSDTYKEVYKKLTPALKDPKNNELYL